MSDWRNMLLTKRAFPPLTLTAQVSNSTVTLNANGGAITSGLLYRKDKSTVWSKYYVGNPITLSSIGDYVQFMSTVPDVSDSNYNAYLQFSMTGRIAASGSVQSMSNWSENAHEFAYRHMFDGCIALTTAPLLTARKIYGYAYQGMFRGCTSLKEAPDMGHSLMANGAYACCNLMFYGCTSLVKAPQLPKNRVDAQCYIDMFNGCTALTTAPALPVTVLKENCYQRMFKGCTSLASAPELPATQGDSQCYEEMFSGCNKLKHIKVGLLDWGDYSFSTNWMSGVSGSGTFYKPPSLEVIRDASHIPVGWTVIDND